MTTIKQLSIFLENKQGSLYEVMETLSKAKINIIAATVADTSEYGILRIITSNTSKALEVLSGANKNANISEVVAISCHTEAGAFYENLKKFSEEGVAIEYMYCFTAKEKAILVMRVDDNDKALSVVEKHNLDIIQNSDLETL
ncbi:MAG: acetolactate synthase [Rikenellaceae bacterium]